MSNLLRLSACLFLCVSLNSFGATVYALSGHSSPWLLSFDLETQTTEYITTQNVGFGSKSGLVYQPSPVPLPAGIYLFLSGLVGLGAVRLRKK